MAILPIHEIAETPAFTRQRAALGVADEDYEALLDVYASDPGYGKRIVGTGGLRKGRVAKSNTGKSGGYRVFSVYLGFDVPVFLLWMIDKTADDTITAGQKAIFKQLIAAIKQELEP